MSGPGHNSGGNIGGIAADALRQYVDRIENLREEIKALNEDVAEVYKEARSTGFDVKALKALIAERAKNPNDLAELAEILDIYRDAVNGTPIATRARTADAE